MESENNDQEEEEEFFNEEDIEEVIDLEENGEQKGGEEEEMEMEGEREMDGERESISPVRDDSALTFSKHTKDVFCVDVTQTMAASGGEDDKAYVWNLSDGEVYLDCDGHTDSVTSVSFNAKSTLLATGDLSGAIKIWNMEKKSLETEFHLNSDLEWIHWHHMSDIIFAGANDGTVWMWLVPNSNCRVFPGRGGACSVGALLADGRRLFAAYATGECVVWNLKEEKCEVMTGIVAQKTRITALDVLSPLAATGSEEGTVAVINTDSGRILSILACVDGAAGLVEAEQSIAIESVKFGQNNMLATATVLGEVLIWDISTGIVRQRLEHPNAVVKSLWTKEYYIVTGCTDGVLRLWDSRNGELTMEFCGHRGSLMDFVYSTDLDILVSAAYDHTCKVFPVEQ